MAYDNAIESNLPSLLKPIDVEKTIVIRSYCEASSSSDWNYHELKKGHDAIITAPDELFQLLLPLINK
ncbi:MAG: hypothetical protein ACTHKF_10495 [Candidatus Nitrosocosmicus sp.]